MAWRLFFLSLFLIPNAHHEALTALRMGQTEAEFEVVEDWSYLSGSRRFTPMEQFFRKMKKAKFVWTMDYRGRPIAIPSGLPLDITHLKNSDFRSVAWFIRKRGGY